MSRDGTRLGRAMQKMRSTHNAGDSEDVGFSINASRGLHKGPGRASVRVR